MSYRKRIIEAEVSRKLAAGLAVLIEGPKGCGKTATGRELTASEILLDVDPSVAAMEAVDPGLLLEGAQPRLLDEWQVVPAIWNHVRHAVDAQQGAARFVLTGSAVPPDDATRHTGAGRFARVRMRTMSLTECGATDPAVSLGAMLDGDGVTAPRSKLDVRELIELACIGGWPGWMQQPVEVALDRAIGYLDEVRRVDVRRVDGAARDPEKVGRLLASLGRNVSARTTVRTLAQDVAGSGASVHEDTAAGYLGALERLMVVDPLRAWTPHLRSRARLRQSPVWHFADPSLAIAAIRATPESLLRDLKTFGLIFESLVVRDLRVYAQAHDADVWQYRDSNGLEVDAIVARRNGDWLAVEVKLGVGQVDEAAANLLRFRDTVDTDRVGEPRALIVVVGSGFGYTRPDGVSVVPVAALGV